VLTYEHTIEALADPTRRRIVEQLADGPSTVGELAQVIPVSRPAVSQHMRLLLDAGLVSYRSQGTRNVYRLEPAGFETLRNWLDEFWRDVLAAFESYADEQFTKKENKS
jgi:DNA-binding transcriptional ArsR family regulator